jgi:hypothetical protein
MKHGLIKTFLAMASISIMTSLSYGCDQPLNEGLPTPKGPTQTIGPVYGNSCGNAAEARILERRQTIQQAEAQTKDSQGMGSDLAQTFTLMKEGKYFRELF